MLITVEQNREMKLLYAVFFTYIVLWKLYAGWTWSYPWYMAASSDLTPLLHGNEDSNWQVMGNWLFCLSNDKLFITKPFVQSSFLSALQPLLPYKKEFSFSFLLYFSLCNSAQQYPTLVTVLLANVWWVNQWTIGGSFMSAFPHFVKWWCLWWSRGGKLLCDWGGWGKMAFPF